MHFFYTRVLTTSPTPTPGGNVETLVGIVGILPVGCNSTPQLKSVFGLQSHVPVNLGLAPERRKFIDGVAKGFINDFTPRYTSLQHLVHLRRVSSEDRLIFAPHHALYTKFRFLCSPAASRQREALPHLPLRPRRSPVGLSFSKRRLRIIGARIKGSYPWTPPSQDISSFADV